MFNKQPNKNFVYSTKPKRKTFKIVLLSLIVIILGVGIWLGTVAYKNIKKITALSGNNSLFSLMGDAKQSLKGESDGRTNILLLGMGGKNHPGGLLADTVVILSVDWKTNKVAMMTIPRDLYVKIPGDGWGKINESFAYGENNASSTGGGGQVSSQVVSEVLGIPIHYFVSADFEGFKKIVDSLGGIDVVNEKDLYDASYPADNMIDFDPFKLSAGAQHLDGEVALKYARCRKGTCGDDYGRNSRQMQVIKAIKDKMMSLNIISNPTKLVDLMNIAGDHIRTNMSLGEIKTLSEKQKSLDTQNMIGFTFDTTENGLLISPPQDGRGSIQLPKLGQGEYADIQAKAQNIFNSAGATIKGTSINKKLRIEVLNGSGTVGMAKKAKAELTSAGYNVTKIGDAPKTYTDSVVYDCNSKLNSATAIAVGKVLDGQVKNLSACSGIDLQVIIGTNNNL